MINSQQLNDCPSRGQMSNLKKCSFSFAFILLVSIMFLSTSTETVYGAQDDSPNSDLSNIVERVNSIINGGEEEDDDNRRRRSRRSNTPPLPFGIHIYNFSIADPNTSCTAPDGTVYSPCVRATQDGLVSIPFQYNAGPKNAGGNIRVITCRLYHKNSNDFLNLLHMGLLDPQIVNTRRLIVSEIEATPTLEPDVINLLTLRLSCDQTYPSGTSHRDSRDITLGIVAHSHHLDGEADGVCRANSRCDTDLICLTNNVCGPDNVVVGGTCSESQQCLSGLCESGVCKTPLGSRCTAQTCAGSASCNGKTYRSGTCVNPNSVQIGGRCVADNNQCVSGASCFRSRCVADGSVVEGEVCTESQQCVNGDCLKGICVARPASVLTGGACTERQQCLSGLCEDGICKVGHGVRCVGHNECAGKAICTGSPDRPGRCRFPRNIENGGQCVTNDNCRDFKCIDGTCKGNVNRYCTSHAGCVSGLCESARCKVSAGGGCKTSEQCTTSAAGCGVKNAQGNGICVVPGSVSVGGPCNAYNQCTSGSSCRFDGVDISNSGICIADGGVVNGDSCTANRQCVSGSTCLDSICTVDTTPGNGPIPLGDTCNQGETCVAGASCTGNTYRAGTCVNSNSIQTGGQCATNHQCVSGTCSSNKVCVAGTPGTPPTSNGCTSNADCGSGKQCTRGVCTSTTNSPKYPTTPPSFIPRPIRDNDDAVMRPVLRSLLSHDDFCGVPGHVSIFSAVVRSDEDTTVQLLLREAGLKSSITTVREDGKGTLQLHLPADILPGDYWLYASVRNKYGARDTLNRPFTVSPLCS